MRRVMPTANASSAFGIMIGFIANLVVYNTGTIAWRLQIGM